MKLRYLLAILVVLCVLFLNAACAHSQTLVKIDSGRAFVYMSPRTVMATTYCSPIGRDTVAVVSVLNMAYLANDTILDGIKVHEAVHRDDMVTNHALCRPTAPQLLWMETRAYCSEAHLLTRYGMNSDSLYWSELDKMQRQFKGRLPNDEAAVRGAWYAECGGMLGLDQSRPK